MQTRANPPASKRHSTAHKSSAKKNVLSSKPAFINAGNKSNRKSEPKRHSEDTSLNFAALWGHQFSNIVDGAWSSSTDQSTMMEQVPLSTSTIQLKDTKQKGKKPKVKAVPPKLDIPMSDLFNLDIGSSGIGIGYGPE
ncbi:MAG: hypothetical protein AAFV85_23385, partial [Cyanobacteria bacterium J06634_6]